MAGSAVLRAKKLKGSGIVHAASAHNLRAIQAELGAGGSIDATRCHLNEHLAGPAAPADVADLARAKMAAAGVGKLRKDAVQAIEFVVSIAPGQRLDEAGFFGAAVRWLADRFGGVDNILSADVHRDEAAPHLHLLVLPLMAGRMVGSDAIGGPSHLLRLQTEFFAAVCKPYGLLPHPRRLAGEGKTAAAAIVLTELKRRRDPCLNSALWPALRDHIEADPGSFAALLGVSVGVPTKPKKLRSMTEIFISPGKGPKVEKSANPIGFATPRITEPYLV